MLRQSSPSSIPTDLLFVGVPTCVAGLGLITTPVAGRLAQLATLNAPSGPTQSGGLLAAAKHTLVDGITATWNVPPWLYLGCHASIVAALATLGVLTARRLRRNNRTGWRAKHEARLRDRSTVWAHPGDVDTLQVADRANASRVILGDLEGHTATVAAPRDSSVCVVAPTGSGKTTAVVIPAVMRWAGPVVVTSTKRDVYDVTRPHRQTTAQGHVRVFDPLGVTGQPSATWSPVTGSDTWPGAANMAHWLVDAARVGSNHGAEAEFWQSQARSLIAPLLYWAANTNRTTLDVYRAVQAMRDLTEDLEALGDDDAYYAFVAVWNLPADTRGGVFATALSLFGSFADPNIRHITCASPDDPYRLDWADLLDNRGTLYLVASEHAQDQLRPVFEAMLASLMRHVSDRYLTSGQPLTDRLLLVLDEAAHVAAPARLDSWLNAYRGQGVAILTVWQSVSQIEQCYGPNRWRSVYAGHPAKVVLGGIADEPTLTWASHMIGAEAVASQSFGATGNSQEGGRDLVVAPVEWLRQRPAGTAVAVVGNLKPLRLVTAPWYTDPTLTALVPDDVRQAHATAATR